MPYTHFRYIAYEVPTATSKAGGSVESGFDAGTECPSNVLIPVPDDINTDAKYRLKRLALAVQLAKTRINSLGDNDQTLKIFVAPEFYFRPPASLGANYINNTYPNSVLTQIINVLREMFTHPDFAHWLIVPGTIMWNTSESMVKPDIYYNSCFQIRGGPVAHSGDNVFYTEKKIPSGIDGVPYGPGQDLKIKLVEEAWKNRKRRIFDIDTVSVGIEICLDHGLQVLKNVLADWPKNEGANREISLHILTAGGMPMKDTSVAAKAGGYLLRNDGYSNNLHSQLKKVQRHAFTDPLMGELHDTTSSDLSGKAIMDVDIAEESHRDMPGGPGQVPMKGAEYLKFTQRVVIYPVKALP
jgi:hypothetical protein